MCKDCLHNKGNDDNSGFVTTKVCVTSKVNCTKVTCFCVHTYPVFLKLEDTSLISFQVSDKSPSRFLVLIEL